MESHLRYVLTLAAAFEDFLQTFKSTPASALANALNGMNLDEDDLSDEYDFMDDEDENGENTRRQARMQAKQPKLKYMELLQKVADRYEDEITIDLDDLEKVDIPIIKATAQIR
jgi:DNA replication licensing factor MCM7